jgi:hypothetical protein
MPLCSEISRHAWETPLPPGPAGWPILGNILELAAAAKEERIHLLMEEWARDFGEVVRVQSGPVVDLLLNSDRAVKVCGLWEST